MGKMTTHVLVNVDPVAYLNDLGQRLGGSGFGQPAIEVFHDANNAAALELSFQWKDLETAKKNFVAVKELIESSNKVNVTAQSQLSSRVWPD